jgi:hypothetical protein
MNPTHRVRARRSSIALAVIALVALPALSGCWNGKEASTNLQAGMATGNGIEAEIGTMEVVDVTLVKGEGVGPAQLIGTIVNNGQTVDSLDSVVVDGQPITFRPALTPIRAGQAVPFGYQNAAIKAPFRGTKPEVSTYVPVTFNFRNAGQLKISVMTVPATGIYAGITNTVTLSGVLPAASEGPSTPANPAD